MRGEQGALREQLHHVLRFIPARAGSRLAALSRYLLRAWRAHLPNPRHERLRRRALATLLDMSTDYRHSITNLHRSIHDDVNSARTRLQGVITLLEQAEFTAVIDDLHAMEQRLTELADR